ncbi:MAG TPA: L-aspartate oxidase [bacterium]|nr:L-aspartate oxidase [bacterium]HPS29400.1 L-aspartate oxidase [bacterium]
MSRIYTDALIIGSGLSGLSTALSLADKGIRVLLITKESLDISNSANAQGGIASVVDFDQDSFEKHISDTMTAGAGLNDSEVVRFFVENGPDAINYFKLLGCRFTENEKGSLDLGKEGGHTERRVVHAGDITGMELIKTIKNAVLKHSEITLLENHTAIDIITTSKFLLSSSNMAIGAYILNNLNGQVITVCSKSILIATGGCGKVYLYTSNPDVTSGDGVAIGFRAGVPAVNMEMIQFHPTILYHEKVTSMLISEALRGEGGILIDKRGCPFMDKYHPSGSLAPRDIVARAIDHEMKRTGDDNVFLDMRHLDGNFLRKRFPNIFKICLDAGIDMRKEPIPVVPAAHYMCGGLKSDPHGKTIIPGLFVSGEVAHTGLHGANRLASNSLLEAAVMARYAAKEMIDYVTNFKQSDIEPPEWNEGSATDKDENIVLKQNWDEIRRFMWNYVGIVRSNKRLERALKRLELIKFEIHEYYWNFKVNRDLLELRNITLVAELIIKSAMKRHESRGLHFNIDYPETKPDAINTEIFPEEIV